jgi:hypothetical protein
VPDGYKMLTVFNFFVINPALFARIPYDPVNDFDPVSLAINSPGAHSPWTASRSFVPVGATSKESQLFVVALRQSG